MQSYNYDWIIKYHGYRNGNVSPAFITDKPQFLFLFLSLGKELLIEDLVNRLLKWSHGVLIITLKKR